MTDLLDEVNIDRPMAGYISYADDFILSAEEDEADEVWRKTVEALSEIGLPIEQTKSKCTRRQRNENEHENLTFKEHMVISCTEGTERNSTRVDEEDTTLARGRLEEACTQSDHVDRSQESTSNTRKVEALCLMTSESIARALDLGHKGGGAGDDVASALQIGTENEQGMRGPDGQSLER